MNNTQEDTPIVKKRGGGKPGIYGKRATHTVRVTTDAWQECRVIVKSLGLKGVAELIIKIGLHEITPIPVNQEVIEGCQEVLDQLELNNVATLLKQIALGNIELVYYDPAETETEQF